MRDPNVWAAAKHVVKLVPGVALLVRSLPSRRYMRRLADENDRLREAGAMDLEPVVAATEDLVGALRLTGSRRSGGGVVRVLP